MAIDAGEYFYCAIRDSGELACWLMPVADGLYPVFEGTRNPPAGTFKAVSGGGLHACAIRTNGRLVCWGDDGSGQSSAPKGRFTAVASAWSSTCAIRVDQTIACWGDGPGATAPAGTYLAISGGQDVYCALRTDHTAVCWGDSGVGPAEPAPSGTFRDVAIVDYWRACGIRDDGSLECWGDYFTPKPTGSFIALGNSCALRTDGSIVCWDEELRPPGGSFTAISGECAIRADGVLACWYWRAGRSLPLTDATDVPAAAAPRQATDVVLLLGALAGALVALRLLRRAARADSRT